MKGSVIPWTHGGEELQMFMFPTLRMQILAAVSLVLPLLAETALAQSHIRGTLAGVKDDIDAQLVPLDDDALAAGPRRAI